MVKQITQDYFNTTVKENMDLLGLTTEEAVTETLKQFKILGVDLANILTSVEAVEGSNPILALAEVLKKPSNSTQVQMEKLMGFKELLLQDPAYRIAAGKHGISALIIDFMNRSITDDKQTVMCITTLTSLMDGYPDLLDEKGLIYIFKILEASANNDLLKNVLMWIHKCCIKHEKNRQAFMDRGISKFIASSLKPDVDPELLRILCGVVAALTLDDDVREAISQAHKHASTLAVDLLKDFITLIDAFSNDEVTLCELFLAISAVLVRNEFCTTVVRANGLKYVLDTFSHFPNNKKLHRRVFLVLGCLAGNDDVKSKIITSGGGSLITTSMALHSTSDDVNIAACNALARICLRSPKNSKELSDLGCVELIFQFMTSNKNNVKALTSGCRALRNMVSHNPEISEELLKLGAEDFLRESMTTKQDSYDDIKTLLKEMGCDVELKELWTGKTGNKLEN